jgi:hypothetical protein
VAVGKVAAQWMVAQPYIIPLFAKSHGHSHNQGWFCTKKLSSGLQDKFGGHRETAAANKEGA